MTIESMRKTLTNYCHDRTSVDCASCPLFRWEETNCQFDDPDTWTDARIEKAFGTVFHCTTLTNNVDHPTHYNREGGMECIDEMLLIFGREAVMNFCLCNAWKYRYRAADKNGAEDLKKADWYLAKYAELRGGDE